MQLLLSAAILLLARRTGGIGEAFRAPPWMWIGGAMGLLAGAAVSGLMYFGLLTIPAHRLFAVTSGLITMLAAGMASQAVLFLQNGGYIGILTDPVWNSS